MSLPFDHCQINFTDLFVIPPGSGKRTTVIIKITDAEKPTALTQGH